jgi:hypothetical protein
VCPRDVRRRRRHRAIPWSSGRLASRTRQDRRLLSRATLHRRRKPTAERLTHTPPYQPPASKRRPARALLVVMPRGALLVAYSRIRAARLVVSWGRCAKTAGRAGKVVPAPASKIRHLAAGRAPVSCRSVCGSGRGSGRSPERGALDGWTLTDRTPLTYREMRMRSGASDASTRQPRPSTHQPTHAPWLPCMPPYYRYRQFVQEP